MTFIFRDPKVYISTDDWAKADGATLTDDNEVVPIMDLTPDVVSVEVDFTDIGSNDR